MSFSQNYNLFQNIDCPLLFDLELYQLKYLDFITFLFKFLKTQNPPIHYHLSCLNIIVKIFIFLRKPLFEFHFIVKYLRYILTRTNFQTFNLNHHIFLHHYLDLKIFIIIF